MGNKSKVSSVWSNSNDILNHLILEIWILKNIEANQIPIKNTKYCDLDSSSH